MDKDRMAMPDQDEQIDMTAAGDAPPVEPGSPDAEAANPLERPPGRKRQMAEMAAAFLVGVFMMLATFGVAPQGAEHGLPGNDSYYHVKMAELLPEVGVVREFPWLRFVWFRDSGPEFVNHHYGFHAFLSPFVKVSRWWTGESFAGGRWSMAVCFGLIVLLIDRLLVQMGLRWRWLWLLLLALLPAQFYMRHAYVRAIAPSLVMMLLIVWAMFAGRLWLLALSVAAYIHLYLGAVMYAPVLVGLYALAAVIGPRGQRRVPWGVIGFGVLGWTVGILTHPYRDGVLEFLRLQVFGTGLSPDIEVGREWKPYQDLWWFAQMAGTVLITWAVAVGLRLRWGPTIGVRALALLLMHAAFFVLICKARRFVEYWPVFGLLSALSLAAPVLNGWVERLERILRGRSVKWLLWLRGGGVGLVLAAGVAIVGWSPLWREVRRSTPSKYVLSDIRPAMDYLRQESSPGDVVFTDDWDVFPVFFYHNHHNQFVVGLDPKFTHERRPDLWERYVKITRGQVPAKVTVDVPDASGGRSRQSIDVRLEDLREHFEARYVITDQEHRALAERLANRPDLAELVYPPGAFTAVRRSPYLIFKLHDLESEQAEGISAEER